MRILFLHGWHSVVGGLKPTFLKESGHTVINPALDDEDFDVALRVAQTVFDEKRPDIIVGSSRGGAVAVNVRSDNVPLVLLCPAWKNWGTAKTVKPNTIILHSGADDVIPLADSQELLANSGLPQEALIEVGNDHRLADSESLSVMLRSCETLLRKLVDAFEDVVDQEFFVNNFRPSQHDIETAARRAIAWWTEAE